VARSQSTPKSDSTFRQRRERRRGRRRCLHSHFYRKRGEGEKQYVFLFFIFSVLRGGRGGYSTSLQRGGEKRGEESTFLSRSLIRGASLSISSRGGGRGEKISDRGNKKAPFYHTFKRSQPHPKVLIEGTEYGEKGKGSCS